MLYNRVLIYAFIFVFFVMCGYACSARGDAVTGDVTSPPPHWKLTVTIVNDTSQQVDKLHLVDPATRITRLWDTKDACVEFLTTDEFKAILQALAQSLVASGHDLMHTEVAIACEVNPDDSI